jgi:predicted RNase H-like HicB family nuclease
MNIKISIEIDEDGIFVATCPSLPGCISQGETRKEAVSNIREAIKLHLDSLAKDGIPLFNTPERKESIIKVAV